MTEQAMTKAEALALLGGNCTQAASRIGITLQAVCAWPDVLTARMRDRVQAALWREYEEHKAREARRAFPR